MDQTHQPSSPEPSTARFSFIRSGLFRSIQADGSWGRVNPFGLIHLSFYNECVPTPSQVTQGITPDGKWSAEMPKLTFSTDANIVREIEVDVIMTIEAAKTVRANLDNFINMAEQMKKNERDPSST